MIKSLELNRNNTNFTANKSVEKQEKQDKPHLLPDTAKTRAKQGYQKTTSAIIDYPVKGLRGDVNSNFYEFLSMGIIPYLAGSAMLMLVFNMAKCIGLFSSQKAKIAGNKLALGVVFYGVFKNISKNLLAKPVKAATGVNINKPYENIVYQMPKGANDKADLEVLHQHRSVFDSKEFYRKDLLDKKYFEDVAKKLKLGTDLNDPISETSPIIQNIISTTKTATSLASYGFAGLGVAIAAQDSWIDFFNSFSKRAKFVKNKEVGFFTNAGNYLKNAGQNALDITKMFFKSFGKSFKELWQGRPGTKGYMKHAGKTFIALTAIGSTYLTANAIFRAKNMAKNKNKMTIDKNKEVTEL